MNRHVDRFECRMFRGRVRPFFIACGVGSLAGRELDSRRKKLVEQQISIQKKLEGIIHL
jgi:hypothetical protein